MSDLKQLIADRDALNERIKKVGKEEFGALIAGLFESEPELENFGWWNAPDDAFNDGASPGLSNLTVNIEYDEDRGIDVHNVYGGYSYSDPLGMRVREAFKDWSDDFVAWLFDHERRWENETMVVFPDRIEFLNSPEY